MTKTQDDLLQFLADWFHEKKTLDFHPAGFRVRIRPLPEPTSVIALPQNTLAQRRYSGVVGVVIEVGETAFETFGGNPWVKPGDIALFRQNAGVIFPGDGSDVDIVVNDEDVVASISSEEFDELFNERRKSWGKKKDEIEADRKRKENFIRNGNKKDSNRPSIVLSK